MTSTDLFGGAAPTTEVDPEKAATALGDILGFFHGEAFNGASAISSGIGNMSASEGSTTTTTTTPSTGTATTGDEASPVPQGTAVSQPYGNNGHPGVDLSVPVGTQILAANTGTVTHAANDDPGGYGDWVEITGDDGIITRYGHLSGTTVTQGSKVHAGQVIGQSGGAAGATGSGNSTGPHLHFEVRQGDHTIDPTPFLAGGYQIVGGVSGDTTTATQPDPQALAAVQLQNVVDVLSGREPQSIQPTQSATTPTATPGAGAPDTGNFASDLLTGLGVPVTPENLRVIDAWMRAEGGASHNNPLNTTQGAPGASDFNSVGVKTYTSYQQGLQATIQTLTNGLYSNILDALRSGTSAKAVADAIAASPWGTGQLVQQIIAGG